MHELTRTDPAVETIWRAFELRPEPAPTLDPKGDYLQNAWANSVYPLAARLGVTMKLPPVQPRSRLAHEAAHWARSLGRFDDYHQAIFRVFFERGENIGQISVLMSLASEAGLNQASLAEALKAHEFTQSVLADEEEAHALGITGVPAFIADRKAARTGVQSLESLRQLVEYDRAGLIS